eukprot:TRINITY_DN16896_c0_g1_i1.p1 TRINITY_DN16896_c0_g1~~TRINITY_DN16896_c0_g1_i1.p1  ORF type:complete len:608 (-),score=56.47 TRINITY_DN16896_c0_g1_i1:670-2493(-)
MSDGTPSVVQPPSPPHETTDSSVAASRLCGPLLSRLPPEIASRLSGTLESIVPPQLISYIQSLNIPVRFSAASARVQRLLESYKIPDKVSQVQTYVVSELSPRYKTLQSKVTSVRIADVQSKLASLRMADVVEYSRTSMSLSALAAQWSKLPKRAAGVLKQRSVQYALLFALLIVMVIAPSVHLAFSSAELAAGLPADIELGDVNAADKVYVRNLEIIVDADVGTLPNSPPKNTSSVKKKQSIIAVGESPECKVPRPRQLCKLKPRERIHLVVVSAMWYREPFTQEETHNMLRSVISQTACKLWIHFLVAGHPETSAIPLMMDQIGAYMMLPNPAPFTLPPTHNSDTQSNRGYVNATTPGDAAVLYSLHFIPTEWVVERAKGLQLYPLAHHAGVPGMCKFFIADILWQVKQALYLDVDMIMAGDIQDLWGYLKEMQEDPEMLYWMGNNHPEGHNKRRLLRPFCSCQLVLDLERMRAANVTRMLLTALDGRAPKSLKDYVEDGDQWLFSWLCKQYKRACKILPRMWNVSGCSKPVPYLGLNARGKEANGSCWRVVHFNCMGHVRKKKGSYVTPKDWVEPVRWARALKPGDLRQSQDQRDWKKWKGASR